jgi:predicted aspartyl protease
MKIVAYAAALVALLDPACAQAACKLTSFEMPVTMEGLRPLVSVKVAGKPVKLLLDSGAFFSSLDAKFAAEQGLRGPTYVPTGSHLQIDRKASTTGVAGKMVTRGIVTTSLEFGGTTFSAMQFMTVEGVGEVAGLLGQNVLQAADNEYDLKNGVLRFVRPADCGSDDLAYWVKPGMAYSMTALEKTNRENRHTISTITINGVKMRAYFDTGAPTSFITARAAARAGVKTSDPGVTPAGMTRGVDQTPIKTWLAPFADIKIGDEEIKNTRLTIGDSRADFFDVLIGADFFMAHRVYVANSQGKLYFSYGGGPVFRPPVRDAADAGGGDARP